MHSRPFASSLWFAFLVAAVFCNTLSAAVPVQVTVTDVQELYLQSATTTAPAQEIPRQERTVTARYDLGFARYAQGQWVSPNAGQATTDLAPDTQSRRIFDGTVPAGGFRIFQHRDIRLVGEFSAGAHQLISPDGAILTVVLPAPLTYPDRPEFAVATTQATDEGGLQIGFKPFRGAPAGSIIQVSVFENTGTETLVYQSPGYGEAGALPATTELCQITSLNPNQSYRVAVTYLTPILNEAGEITRTVYLRGARAWAVVSMPARSNNLSLAPQWPSDERLSRGSFHEVRFFAQSDLAVDPALYPAGSYFSYPSGTYILLQNGQEIARTERPPFTLDTSALPPLATYQVVVQTPSETRSTRTFVLEVIDREEKIRIVRQPSPDEAAARARGAALVLRTDAVGPNGERFNVDTFAGVSPVNFRWYHNGQATGQEGPYRIFNQISAEDEGVWQAVVHCGGQSVRTESFRVTLSGTPTVPTLVLTNVSALVHTAGGDDTAIVGAATRAESTLLMRHVGPGLREFGVDAPLANPALRVFHGDRPLASNDDWLGTDAQTMKIAGAFPLVSGSLDAGLRLEVPAGLISAHMTASDGGAGTSLVEIYSLAGAPVRNFSVRGRLEGSATEASVGFTLSGAGTRQFLIRAMGPGLEKFGLSSRLDPQLSLLVGRHTYAANQSWEINTDPAAIEGATQKVGAIPLAAGTGESALLVSLSAGVYTVVLNREANSVGHYLLELWEVP